MELSSALTGLLAGAALLASVVALVLAAAAVASQRQVRRTYRMFARGRHEDPLALLADSAAQVGRLQRELDSQTAAIESLRELTAAGICRVGSVHYDAFSDMGGQLSFSAALLDGHGDGLVLTSINGRHDSRTYVKRVVAGAAAAQPAGPGAARELSPEERDAVQRALTGPGRTGSRPGRVAGTSGAPGRPAAAEIS